MYQNCCLCCYCKVVCDFTMTWVADCRRCGVVLQHGRNARKNRRGGQCIMALRLRCPRSRDEASCQHMVLHRATGKVRNFVPLSRKARWQTACGNEYTCLTPVVPAAAGDITGFERSLTRPCAMRKQRSGRGERKLGVAKIDRARTHRVGSDTTGLSMSTSRTVLTDGHHTSQPHTTARFASHVAHHLFTLEPPPL